MRVAACNLDTWPVGFEDECWWSRLALPTLSSWAEEGTSLRLLQRSVAKDDPEPKVISCYGLYVPQLDDTWIRFVDGRPVSSITTQFLRWFTEKLEALGKKAHLGQCFLAHIQRGQALARHTQPPGQAERRGGEDCELLFAQAESVAQRYRAQMGSWQAQSGRARGSAWCLRARG